MGPEQSFAAARGTKRTNDVPLFRRSLDERHDPTLLEAIESPIRVGKRSLARFLPAFSTGPKIQTEPAAGLVSGAIQVFIEK